MNDLIGRRCALKESLIDRDAESGEIAYGRVVEATAKSVVVLVEGQRHEVAARHVHVAEANGTFRNRVQRVKCDGYEARRSALDQA